MKGFLDNVLLQVILHSSAEHLLSDSDLEVLTGFECQLCLGAKKFSVH